MGCPNRFEAIAGCINGQVESMAVISAPLRSGR
jgi:hypothetical protein